MNLLLLALFSFHLHAAEPMTLALNWKPEPQFGGFYEAKEYFAKAGLDVKIQEGGSGTPTVQMLANGKVDWAIVSAEEILIANDRNPKNPLVAVFAVYQTAPVILMCHKERGFKTLADIFNHPGILAWQNGLTYALYLKKQFPKAKVKTVPYGGGISAYLSDPNYCQQGFLTSEPLLAEKSQMPASTFLVSEAGFNPYLTVLTVRESFLKNSPEVAAKFVMAVRQGWAAYLKNPAATNVVMAAANKTLDGEIMAKSALAQHDLIAPKGTTDADLGKMRNERWQELIDQLKILKLIKRSPSAGDAFRNL